MCVIQRGLASEAEGDKMTLQVGYHGGGSQLYPNQITGARENYVLSCLRALFQVLSSICFSWQLSILCTMAFMLTYAYGEVQTGIWNAENDSPDPLWPPSPSRANVKVVMTVLAIIGGIGLAGRMLHQRWQAFTEADINMGLMSEPAVPRRSNPTFEILPSID